MKVRVDQIRPGDLILWTPGLSDHNGICIQQANGYMKLFCFAKLEIVEYPWIFSGVKSPNNLLNVETWSRHRSVL